MSLDLKHLSHFDPRKSSTTMMDVSLSRTLRCIPFFLEPWLTGLAGSTDEKRIAWKARSLEDEQKKCRWFFFQMSSSKQRSLLIHPHRKLVELVAFFGYGFFHGKSIHWMRETAKHGKKNMVLTCTFTFYSSGGNHNPTTKMNFDTIGCISLTHWTRVTTWPILGGNQTLIMYGHLEGFPMISLIRVYKCIQYLGG